MNRSPPTPAFLFDLDGTLLDSVYQHILAWREALESCGIQLSVWRIYRRMGMSGGLFTVALLRETGRAVTQDQIEELQGITPRPMPANSQPCGRCLGRENCWIA